MIKEIISVVAIVCVCATSVAQKRLDAHSSQFLNHLRAIENEDAVETQIDSVQKRTIFPRTMVRDDGVEIVRAIVTLSDDASQTDLSEMGVQIEGEVGDRLIVSLPVDSLQKLSQAECLKTVRVERRAKLRNSATRSESRVDEVNECVDVDGNYLTGQGVVIGMIDTGIDYNHVNFIDADGNSRVKYAISGSTEYTTTSEIADLTTDTKSYDHGTHTTGTAAGSYSDNDYQGMAPDAELALCGMNDDFSDAQILLACNGIINYAKDAGKPVVINMSIGLNDGPHDGSDDLCKAMDELCSDGVIMVVAAGNEGDMQIYLGKEFAEGDTVVSTLINDVDYKGNYYYNEIEAYTYGIGRLPRIQMFVASKSTNEKLMVTDTISLTEDEQEWLLSEQDCYSDFTTYYSTYSGESPEISITSSYGDDNCCLDIVVIGQSKSSNRYYVGFTLIGQAGDAVHVWGADSYAEFISNGSSEFTAGDASKSINSMACGDNVLSVGCYTIANSYKTLSGQTYTYSGYKIGYITDFSSYGIDMRGISRPDVCAPGMALNSSYNSYSSSNSKSSDVVAQTTYGDRTYYWGNLAGTSMSTPVVSGIIATWLQYNPLLSAAEIREVLEATSVVDSYVEAGDSVQWGAGKVDAYAGLQYLMSAGVNDIELSQNNVLVYPNPNHGTFRVYTQGEADGAMLRVYSMTGQLVYSSKISADVEAVDVDITGQITTGVYILQIVGKSVSHTARLIIK